MCSIIVFSFFKNIMYNTYRDLHTHILLNNVLKITLDNATYTNCREYFFVILKQFHPSYVTVPDPYSSDSSRLYPNEHYRPERYGLI